MTQATIADLIAKQQELVAMMAAVDAKIAASKKHTTQFTHTGYKGVYTVFIDSEAKSARVVLVATNGVKTEWSYTIGDRAIYDFFNWGFVGTIEKITANTVTIRKYPNSTRTTRIKWVQFLQLNDTADVLERNQQMRNEWYD